MNQLLMISGYLVALVLLIWMFLDKSKQSKKQLKFHQDIDEAKKAQALAEQAKQSLEEQAIQYKEEIENLRNGLQEAEKREVEKSTELKAARESLESEKALLTEAQVKLQDAFKSLASTALEGNNRQFLELAKLELSKDKQAAASDLDKRQTAIDELVKPLKETLERYQHQASEMEKERQRSYSQVELELKKVVETGLSLSKETTALKDALKKPHIRGRWGEVQLRNCIELAGMSEFADVTFQDTTNVEDQRLIPDMTVRMPGDRLVIVDSKTPIDAFIASLEASTEEQRNAEMLRHGKHVRKHVGDLSEKKYAQKLKNSADFTVMFLPNESFLYAALETQPDLVDYALSKKVLIATPPTLIGLLKVIRFGWDEKKLARNAQQISEVGKELHKRLVDFFEAYEEVGKGLEKAQKAFDTGRMRLNSRILSKARQLEELGAKGSKELPEAQL